MNPTPKAFDTRPHLVPSMSNLRRELSMMAGFERGRMSDGTRGPRGWPLCSAELRGPGLKRAMKLLMSVTFRQLSRAACPTCCLYATKAGCSLTREPRKRAEVMQGDAGRCTGQYTGDRGNYSAACALVCTFKLSSVTSACGTAAAQAVLSNLLP